MPYGQNPCSLPNEPYETQHIINAKRESGYNFGGVGFRTSTQPTGFSAAQEVRESFANQNDRLQGTPRTLWAKRGQVQPVLASHLSFEITQTLLSPPAAW